MSLFCYIWDFSWISRVSMRRILHSQFQYFLHYNTISVKRIVSTLSGHHLPWLFDFTMTSETRHNDSSVITFILEHKLYYCGNVNIIVIYKKDFHVKVILEIHEKANRFNRIWHRSCLIVEATPDSIHCYRVSISTSLIILTWDPVTVCGLSLV